MKCPVCNDEILPKPVERHKDPVAQKEYLLFLCPTCHVTFSDPMKNPGPEWYQRFNERWEFRGRESTVPGWREKYLQGLAREMSVQTPQLLDIGCGYGHFLSRAKNLGFKTHGIDFDSLKTKIAKDRGAGSIFEGSFEAFYERHRDVTFDVITFFQLLEHVEDPSRFIGRIKDLLVPGGYIMLDLPNDGRILKSASGIMDYPPHHLTRWNKDALVDFLDHNGFKVVTATSVYPLTLFYDSIFSLMTVNTLAVIKKLLLRHRSLHELRSIPLDDCSGSARIIPARNIRALLTKVFKTFYFLLMLPSALLLLPLLLYYRAKDRGLFLFVIAERT